MAHIRLGPLEPTAGRGLEPFCGPTVCLHFWHSRFSMIISGLPAWCQDHDHLPPFHFGHLFNYCDLSEVVPDPFQHIHSKFLVRELATTESQGDFNLVSCIQKPRQISDLDIVIADIRSRAKLDLLDRDLFLLLSRFLLFFRCRVQKLPIIHQTTNRRLCIWRDLYQIQISRFGHLLGLGHRHDTQLPSTIIDQTDVVARYILVDALLFCYDYVMSPPKYECRASRTGQAMYR